jgi:hypothetical protein
VARLRPLQKEIVEFASAPGICSAKGLFDLTPPSDAFALPGLQPFLLNCQTRTEFSHEALDPGHLAFKTRINSIPAGAACPHGLARHITIRLILCRIRGVLCRA